jgi:hypothetical protein
MLVVPWEPKMCIVDARKPLTSPHAEKIRRVGGVNLVDDIRIHC